MGCVSSANNTPGPMGIASPNGMASSNELWHRRRQITSVGRDKGSGESGGSVWGVEFGWFLLFLLFLLLLFLLFWLFLLVWLVWLVAAASSAAAMAASTWLCSISSFFEA